MASTELFIVATLLIVRVAAVVQDWGKSSIFEKQHQNKNKV